MNAAKNWFEGGGENYARFRPEYPETLTSFLTSVPAASNTAVDVGCGTGQLTRQLATRFEKVTGADPSAEQIANAAAAPNVSYVVAPAEDLPLPDASTDLVTAAQAAHWFDLPRFYAEARRIAAPGAIVALISYGVLALDSDLNERFQTFYTKEIGPYWPPERQLVDEGYRTLDFPFTEIAMPDLVIERRLRLNDFLGYLSTWSAARAARDAGKQRVLTDFARDLEHL